MTHRRHRILPHETPQSGPFIFQLAFEATCICVAAQPLALTIEHSPHRLATLVTAITGLSPRRPANRIVASHAITKIFRKLSAA
jgi:hypothetical protein